MLENVECPDNIKFLDIGDMAGIHLYQRRLGCTVSGDGQCRGEYFAARTAQRRKLFRQVRNNEPGPASDFEKAFRPPVIPSKSPRYEGVTAFEPPIASFERCK